MQAAESYVNERLDHLGIVAGVCQKIGLATWLDAQDPTHRQNVSVGTATTAMVLNGLGFSNRQLYLVPQYFENKPVEHLLGEGITADMLNDDCLGRTLDWLYAHDPTKLFAGIARQARQIFGVQTKQIHVDTTSFSVSGEYATKAGQSAGGTPVVQEAATDPALIAITYGYSRDHREDLKQWMLALATTHDGDIPLFLQPLDGNSSDKGSLLAAIQAIQEQLRATDEAPGVYVADNGVYSEANMRALNQAKVKWISRVSETSTDAKAALAQSDEIWQVSEDGNTHWVSQIMSLPQGKERWVIVYTSASQQRALASLQQKVKRTQAEWEKKCWHLGNRRFACETDAQTAMEQEKKGQPAWLSIHHELVAHARHASRGRPCKDAPLKEEWQIVATVAINQELTEQEAFRKACWIIGTNILETAEISDGTLTTTYKEQGGVERGFRFLKDPLFLASSVFVKKPERIMALSLIMVLCLLVYRLAEFRLRARLVETAQTIPDQVQKPTMRPTMRWVFQCFEGIDLLHIHVALGSQSLVLRLQPVHRLVLALLGPPYENLYNISS